MNEPSIKKPTKKTFHFPKAATQTPVDGEKQTDAPVEAASVKAKAAPKQKAAAKTKVAPKAKPTDAKVVAAEKPLRAAKESAKKEPAKKEAAKKEAVKKEPAKKASTKKDVVKKEAVKKDVVKKEKVVRDSFTMPKSDYDKIAALKQKCLAAGVSVKKSELLRAGLVLLAGATSSRLLAAISAVETVKTGRPTKS